MCTIALPTIKDDVALTKVLCNGSSRLMPSPSASAYLEKNFGQAYANDSSVDSSWSAVDWGRCVGKLRLFRYEIVYLADLALLCRYQTMLKGGIFFNIFTLICALVPDKISLVVARAFQGMLSILAALN